jgi:PD-(D/E)XK nuclease superfamily
MALSPKLKLLSHSSLTTLHACPRKFELYRLNAGEKGKATVDTAFGHAFGTGIQSLIESEGNIDLAIVTAIAAWDTSPLEENSKSNKSIWEVVLALQAFASNQLPALLVDWEIARLKDGKPAAELSFKVTLPDGFAYRGFVDLVLKHRRENRYKIWELKTTGSYVVHEAQYKNSFQGVGYGVVLDAIASGTGAESDYFVDYYVYKTKSREFELMPFLKSNLQRMRWLSQLLLETEKLKLYDSMGMFPMHGENCYTFFRPCEYFGICEMSNSSLVDMDKAAIVPTEEPVDFTFDFTTLLTNQQEQLQ